MRNVSVLPDIDTGFLDLHLLKDGLLVPQKAEVYDNIDPVALRVWCLKRGFYSLPTIEAVDFLKDMIGPASAIEVGAGHGAWARALGIKATDSYLQHRPEIRALYEGMGQPVVDYPPDVLKYDAHAAIKRFKPRFILGAWITQKWEEGDAEGNMFGPDERKFLQGGRTYIHIGNEQTHRHKKIMRYLKAQYHSPALFSRSDRQDLNVIWVFHKGG